jgi:hypothetical protein
LICEDTKKHLKYKVCFDISFVMCTFVNKSQLE